MNKKNSDTSIVLIVLIVIAIFVIYILSLGAVNSSGFSKIPEEFKDSKDEAKRRHKRLVELIQKQEALKTKLNKKFKRTYFFVRVGLVLIWFAALAAVYFFGLIKNLGDALNYSEASILLIIVINFLTFGTLTNLKNYIDLIKTKTENWIYGKYITIDSKIEINKSELSLLSKQIDTPNNN